MREKGEEPVDLQKECPQDLEQREKDQYLLYLEICKQYSTTIVSNLQMSGGDSRLQKITQVEFILPEKDQKVVTISLQDEMPFLKEGKTD